MLDGFWTKELQCKQDLTDDAVIRTCIEQVIKTNGEKSSNQSKR